MTTDFLIGAIRASRDLHPQVKTELEEILYREDQIKPIRNLVDEEMGDARVIDAEKIKAGLRCCQVDKYGDLEHCDECPYNEVSICVQECRTAMNRDAEELIDYLFEKVGELK